MAERTLLLRLAGPLQSWGTTSRFTRRATDYAPSKSGVLGMLAAAKGLRRTEPLAELLGVRFGVRVDQPGMMLRDFQTSRPLDDQKANATLAERFYLSDAVFLAAVEGEETLVEGLAEALGRPRFLPYLGRRSCPPSQRILIGVTSLSLVEALKGHRWLASEHHRRRQGAKVTLDIVRDVLPSDTDQRGDSVHDEPVSFDPRHRRYEWRRVRPDVAEVDNPDARVKVAAGDGDGGGPRHDPLAFFGG